MKFIIFSTILLLLTLNGIGQVKIIHSLDKHDRLKSTQYPDSLILKRTFDNVGNIISEVIVNPCFDRPNPIVTILGSLSICQGDSIKLTAPVSLSYKWSTGDTSRSIVVKIAGTYNVTTFNTLNCSKTSLPVTVVVNSLPEPEIDTSSSTTFCYGYNTILTSHLTGSYLWNTGDTTRSIIADTSKTYTLTFTDSNGCSASISKQVLLFPQPHANFTINDTGQCLNGNSYVFSNSSTISIGTLSHLWRFGDGSTSSLLSPTKTYSSNGSYKVTLISTSNNGCIDSISKYITVYPKPTPSFSVNGSVLCAKSNIVFTNTTTLSQGTLSFVWEFGDGTYSNISSPTKTYNVGGVYNVKLIAISDKGCKDSTQTSITVNQSPTVGFSINDSVQCLNTNQFVFTNASSISIGTLIYHWNFGDGNTSDSINSIHTYSSYGSYTVKLIAISNTGCKDSIVHTVQVTPKPTSSFSVNNPDQCINNNNFVFSNSSSISIGSLSYMWNFGDSTFSTNTNPTKTYSSVGNYTVKLIAKSGNSCSDTFSLPISVNAIPTSLFTINDSIQCLNGNNFVLNNTSTGGSNLNYLWNFGDGNTSTNNSPSHTYASAGTYQISLVTTNNNSCKDTIIHQVKVSPKPAVSFTVNTTTQCLNTNSFTFTNTSSISTGSLTHLWLFGDGSTSTAYSPTKTFNNSGSFTVELICTSNLGCVDSTYSVVIVAPKPSATFSINQASQCFIGNYFIFTNTSTISTGVINSYLWDFGDGNSTNSTNPSKTYATPGTYSVKLIATSNLGCKDTVIQSVTVYPNPTANFNANLTNQCINGNQFTFSNTSNISSGNLIFKWYFGDGNTSDSINSSHIYNSPGTYQVKLIATSNYGCKDSIVHTINVYPKPNPDFSINDTSQCINGNYFSLTNNSTSTGTMSYTWRFGDGTTNSSTNTSKTYTSPGTYSVKLIVTNIFGCKDSITHNVIVFPKPTTAFTIAKDTQCVYSGFTFVNNSTITNDSLTYLWRFGDGATSNSINAIHAYTISGIYSVTLVAFSSNGCLDSITHTVFVLPNPQPQFTINTTSQCLNGNSFGFSNTSIGTSNMTYQWNFGDGSSSNLQSPSKIYSSSGQFLIKLVVANSYGCKDSVSHLVRVYPKPIPIFTINDSSQCINGNLFVLTNSSTLDSGSLAFHWNFGDGQSSTSSNPSHSYSAPGNYNITLLTTSNFQCKDSTVHMVTVFPKPYPSFLVNDSTQCLDENEFTFTNTSYLSSGTPTYTWYFGDGDTSTQFSPSHIYRNSGLFHVNLIEKSNQGCVDTFTKLLTVFYEPIANFLINDSIQCLNGNSVILSNTSSIGGSDTMNYYWKFGDGITSNLTHPTHTYQADGHYSITLLATSSNGCIDSISKNIVINAKPNPSYTINDSGQCLNTNNFIFTNTSSINNSDTLRFKWSFGDGFFDTTENPIHHYSQEGIYSVGLIVKSNHNCIDSVFHAITVFPKPNPAFSINDSEQCYIGNSFKFKSLSNISDNTTLNYYWDYGDGHYSTADSPTYSYSSPGLYLVKLRIGSIHGCLDSTTRNVYVRPNSVPSFTINNANQCLDSNIFSFSNTSTISSGSIKYLWNFGDGGSDTATSPNHTYVNSGTYNVILKVISSYQCVDSIKHVLTVFPKPIAAFSISNNKQCYNLNNFDFLNNSTISSGTLNYFWDFGDSTNSTSQDPSHNYKYPGIYNIKLIVVSNNGCQDIAKDSIWVFPRPKAYFTVNSDTQCWKNNLFQFKDSSTVSSGNYTCFWKFGDGDTSSSLIVTKKYLTDSYYNVTLIVTSNNGCIDSVTKAVIVHPTPNADFDVNSSSQCLTGNIFKFINKSGIRNGNLGMMTYFWDFGDDSTSYANDPMHQYSKPDTYSVSLIARSLDGCLDTIRKTVIVYPEPKAIFTVNTREQCLVGNNYIFDNKSIISSGSIVSYQWNFGNNQFSNAFNPIFSYTQSGIYIVKLVVTSDFGCKDSAYDTIIVYPKPIVSFNTINRILCMNEQFNFQNNSTIKDDSMRFTWDFGDGTISNLKVPIHQYKASGIYIIKLVGESFHSCKDSTFDTVTVYHIPKLGFKINDSIQCYNQNRFIFEDTTSSKVVTYSRIWDFGDGISDTNKVTQHIYNKYGVFNIKMTIRTINNCIESIIKKVTIHPVPDVGFTVNDTTQCLDQNNFVLSDTTPVDLVNHKRLWDYGDGNSDTAKSTVHKYTIPGQYHLKLKILTENGCVDSLLKFITVYAEKDTPTIMESSHSILNSSSLDSNQWYFNDSIIIGATSSKLQARWNGSYRVGVTDGNGCVRFSEPFNYNIIGKKADIVLFPNPAVDNYVKFTFISSDYSEFFLEIIDALGRTISTKKYTKPITENVITEVVDLTMLSPGIYYFRFKTSTEIFGTLKMNVIK